MMTLLKSTSVVVIYMTFIVMNLERKQIDIVFAIYRWMFHPKFAVAVSENWGC